MNDPNLRYYAAQHEFDISTVGAAEIYILTVVNDGNCYKELSLYFESIKKTKLITSDLPYIFAPTSDAYKELRKNSAGSDLSNTAGLCRILLWNHYAEEFKLNQIPIKINVPNTSFSFAASSENALKLNPIKEEIPMNQLTKFKDEPLVKVELMHGRLVSDYTEEELIAFIRKARKEQESIADLIQNSKRMQARYIKLGESIVCYVNALDALKD